MPLPEARLAIPTTTFRPLAFATGAKQRRLLELARQTIWRIAAFSPTLSLGRIRVASALRSARLHLEVDGNVRLERRPRRRGRLLRGSGRDDAARAAPHRDRGQHVVAILISEIPHRVVSVAAHVALGVTHANSIAEADFHVEQVPFGPLAKQASMCQAESFALLVADVETVSSVEIVSANRLGYGDQLSAPADCALERVRARGRGAITHG